MSGNPPVGIYGVDPATNRLWGGGYDANGNQGGATGNMVYDVSNRMIVWTGTAVMGAYEYDASNKRVYQQKLHYDGNNWVADATEFYFYGITGQKLGTYYAAVSGSGAGASLAWSAGANQVFFGGKLISRTSTAAQEDIRGSVGNYYPYGEDRTATANDAVKFASYVRDSTSGLDYAVNRYHMPGNGRFSSPDPYAASGGTSEPGSWNRYAYTQGDPLNRVDPEGLADFSIVVYGSTYFYSIPPITLYTNSMYSAQMAQSAMAYALAEAQTRWNKVKSAVAGAEDLLFSEDCAGIFISPQFNDIDARTALSNSLDKLFSDGLLRILPSVNSNANVGGFTTDMFGLIYFYQYGPFFTGRTGTGGPPGGSLTGLPLTVVQQVMIIHEFLHWTGVVGPDSEGQQYRLPNGDVVTGSAGVTDEIVKKCFK